MVLESHVCCMNDERKLMSHCLVDNVVLGKTLIITASIKKDVEEGLRVFGVPKEAGDGWFMFPECSVLNWFGVDHLGDPGRIFVADVVVDRRKVSDRSVRVKNTNNWVGRELRVLDVEGSEHVSPGLGGSSGVFSRSGEDANEDANLVLFAVGLAWLAGLGELRAWVS